jgi:hypothetical protein
VFNLDFFQIKFVDYNFTSSSDLNLNWELHLNKTIDFHSLVIFEGSNVRMRLDKSTVNSWTFLPKVQGFHGVVFRFQLNYQSIEHQGGSDEYFIVSVPSSVALNLGNLYEFCLIFSEDDYHFFLGCSSSFPLIPHRITTVDLNSRILKSTILDSDISNFDAIADKKNNPLYLNDDMTGYSIEVYPSRDYYNTLWPNISLSILIICMSISIVYILLTKYRHYYKQHQTESISPSYSEDSINTQIEDENENTTNKYVKLQATTTL